MKTLRISVAALLISLTGVASAAMAQQIQPSAPPASSPAPTFDPAAQPLPETTPQQADNATTAATPTSATVADEKNADASAPTPDAKAKPVKKHKKPAPEQRSPDAPTPQ